MTDKNLTHIYLLRDRSYSMTSIKEQTDVGFNVFIEKQKEVPGECLVTLVDFDDKYEVVYSNLPLSQVPVSNLQPRGNTALYDSLGKLIEDTGRELAKLPENRRPASVVFAVLTDGYQNASLGGNTSLNNYWGAPEPSHWYKHFTAPQLKTMIEEQQTKYSWNFYFLGANQDAILVGGDLGFYSTNSLTYSGEYVASAMASAANSVSAFRGATASGVSYGEAILAAAFTDSDRTEATDES